MATVVKMHIMVFHIPYLAYFKRNGYEVHVCAKNDYEIKDDCRIPYCDTFFDLPFERSPFRLRNIQLYAKLKKIIDENKYDIIHCHTPMGGVLTRLAARKARKDGTKVIYTAHGFHFYMGAPVLNWIFYYPVEKFLSRYTNVLITINQEDYQRGKSFHAARVEYVPGVGVDIDKFKNEGFDRDAKRRALGLNNDDFMILSVGELNKNKNHAVVIRALAELQRNNVKYYICGKGPLEGELKQLAEKLGVGSQVKLLGFRNDIPELCLAADVFAFPSFREGLPVALMEAMASGLPVVCSNIRGNMDLIENGKGGFLVSPNDLNGMRDAILQIMMDVNKRASMSHENRIKMQNYAQEKVLSSYEQIIRLL